MALCSVVSMVDVPLKNSGRGKVIFVGLHFSSILEPQGGQLGVKIEGDTGPPYNVIATWGVGTVD